MRLHLAPAWLAMLVLLLQACGPFSDSGPCTIPSTRQQSVDCRTPTAEEALGAEMVIAAADPPLSPAAAAQVISDVGPGLVPVMGYFTVPSDGPVTSGSLPLEGGVDQLVSGVADAFAEDGRTGIEGLVIYGIGFHPAPDAGLVGAGIDTLTSNGLIVYLCALPVASGGCSLSPP